jgi:hypothetical protein
MKECKISHRSEIFPDSVVSLKGLILDCFVHCTLKMHNAQYDVNPNMDKSCYCLDVFSSLC